VDDAALVARAAGARANAYAPYSGIKVGACVETDSGEAFCAANVENASYGLTICAERAAIFAAVAAGHTVIEKIAVVAEGMDDPMPCGACRQVMQEFGVKRVLVGRPDGKYKTYDFSMLLPKPFSI
jgi:cytidine deaminase